jgi:hypothetical protein
MELVSNKHLSSISWMEYRYADGKYMHFMTTNTCYQTRGWSRKRMKMANVHCLHQFEQVLPKGWCPSHKNWQDRRFHRRLWDDGALGLFLRLSSNLAPQRRWGEDKIHHPFWHYCYPRMSKGLCNAGPTFCKMMKVAMKDQVGRNILSYPDDIVGASNKKTTYMMRGWVPIFWEVEVSRLVEISTLMTVTPCFFLKE